jgi:hypothetical protein
MCGAEVGFSRLRLPRLGRVSSRNRDSTGAECLATVLELELKAAHGSVQMLPNCDLGRLGVAVHERRDDGTVFLAGALPSRGGANLEPTRPVQPCEYPVECVDEVVVAREGGEGVVEGGA